ncbi:tRNA pseudouridine(55) synthase TruB [Candidatus Margulisiibacteriota bacterium]
MNGILIVDKPSGITSYDVIRRLKKIIKPEKIGHAGTLDPIATGVLVILLGKFTKMATDLLADDKEYVFEATFGVATDTQDSSGKVLSERPVDISKMQLREAMEKFKGEIEQTPPMVSAVKHKGQPLYKLARQGIEVKREPRKILIKEFELINLDADKAVFKVVCSKGTYIRTLCHDLGELLGCGAHMSQLRRTRSGKYTVGDSRTLDEIAMYAEQGKFREVLSAVRV